MGRRRTQPIEVVIVGLDTEEKRQRARQLISEMFAEMAWDVIQRGLVEPENSTAGGGVGIRSS